MGLANNRRDRRGGALTAGGAHGGLGQVGQRLAHAQQRAFMNGRMEGNPFGEKTNNGGAVLEVTHFFALAEVGAAGNTVGTAVLELERVLKEVQLNAGDQNGGDRHQRHAQAAVVEAQINDGAFVFAVKPFDAFEGDRIDIPSIARNVGDAVDMAVVRGVKAMVHGGLEAQGDVGAVAVAVDQIGLGEQVLEAVRETLGLIKGGAFDLAERADDGVTWAAQGIESRVNGAGAVFELANKTVVQAFKTALLGLVEIEVVGKQTPHGQRHAADQRLLNARKPTHKPCGQATRNAVGEEEIDLFLLGQSL